MSNLIPMPVNPELSDVILAHLARYRLSVFLALQRLPTFQTAGPRLLKDVLRHCKKNRWVGTAPLHAGAQYWHLDAAGAERCGLSKDRSGPLSEPAKLRAMAILRFCCLSDSRRERILPGDLGTFLPMVIRPGLPDAYYFDPQGAGKIGLLRIDGIRKGRWDRIIAALREDIQAHSISPAFRLLVQAGRFEITVLTAFRQKAARIYEALSRCPDAQRVPVQVIALPELLSLVSPR